MAPGLSVESSSSAGSYGMAAPPALKSKKSLDWISKSFKRKSSSVSVTSSSSESASSFASVSGAAGASNSSQHHHHFSSRKDRELHGSAANRVKNGGEPLLSIPGSPAIDGSSSWSRPPSSQGGGGGDASDFDARSQSSSSSSHQHQQHTSTYATASARRSPLPSPTTIPVSTTPVIPVTLRETPRHAKEDSTKTPPSPTKSTALPAPGPLNGSTSRAAKRSSSDYEQLLVHLSSRKALRTMLDDPVGLWKFGQFMASEMNAETLVFWLNAEQHRNDLKRLYSLTQRIHSLHIPSNSPLALNITSNERYAIERSIKAFTNADDPFKVARDTAFQALYIDAWPRFLQWRLELLHNKMRDGGMSPPQTSFTLADPSQDRDQPLLLVSDGFTDLSGYSRADVLMRNCRFLQGPGTAPAVVDRIRQACKNGTPVTEMLLNYRKDGVPFWSLLRIIPLRNGSGKLKYLLGAQINVTAQLAATPDLAHLLGDDLDPVDMAPRPPYEHDLVESQRQDTDLAMRSYLDSLDKDKTVPSTRKADLERRDIANKSSLLSKIRGSPVLPGTPQSATNQAGTSSPALGATGCPNQQARPRSANRDMHLQAAAALALDNSMGSSSRPLSWNGGVPLSNRPTTSASLFQRPGTAYSMVDTEGKARAQLSLHEQTKAFTESSSFYIILDSSASTILFVSENLPASIKIGGDFGALVGPKVFKAIKETIGAGERIDLDSVSFNVAQEYDPSRQWKQGVKICLTPLKDQINEVGAVVVLVSRAAQ